MPPAELAISKSGSPFTLVPSGLLTYTLQVTNMGTAPAANILLTNTVSANTQLEPGSLSGDANSAGNGPGSLITWDTGQTLSVSTTSVLTTVVSAGLPGDNFIYLPLVRSPNSVP